MLSARVFSMVSLKHLGLQLFNLWLLLNNSFSNGIFYIFSEFELAFIVEIKYTWHHIVSTSQNCIFINKNNFFHWQLFHWCALNFTFYVISLNQSIFQNPAVNRKTQFISTGREGNTFNPTSIIIYWTNSLIKILNILKISLIWVIFEFPS